MSAWLNYFNRNFEPFQSMLSRSTGKLPGQTGRERHTFQDQAANTDRRERVGREFADRAAEASTAGRRSIEVPVLHFIRRAEEEVGGQLLYRPL